MEVDELARLIALVLGKPFVANNLFEGVPALIGPPDELPGPFEIPREFVAKLAATNDDALPQLSARWMAEAIPDFAAHKQTWEGSPVWTATTEEWRERLVSLTSFARTATANGQGIYVDAN
jgi:hypothetical protein